MADLAKRIEVTRDADGHTLKIDGKDFPWYVSDEGIATTLSRRGEPSITIEIPAEEVVIADRPMAKREGS